ncbi:LPXTG cell wall anchor domain-containing protein, partial [Glutamicibacter arilaitensis]
KALPPTGVENVLLLSVIGLVTLALGTLLARRSKVPGDIDA